MPTLVILHRDHQMAVSHVVIDDRAAYVVLVHPLANRYDGRGLHVVEAVRDRFPKPPRCLLPDRFALDVLDVVQVVQ